MTALIGKGLVKGIFLSIVIGIFILTAPGTVLSAQVSASAQAQLSWDSITFSSSSALNWISVDGDTRSSFSSAAIGLNTHADPYAPVDYIDGAPWGNTTASHTQSGANGSVTGSASTVVPAVTGLTQQAAAANLFLTGLGTATVDVAQAVLAGQFTVAQATLLTVTADYSLAATLFNDLSNTSSAYADVSVGLTLRNADTDALFAVDERFYPFSLNGLGSPAPFTEDGTLVLTWNLDPNFIYDFEFQASVAANAAEPVPEPATLILIGSGLFGLAGLRRKLKK